MQTFSSFLIPFMRESTVTTGAYPPHIEPVMLICVIFFVVYMNNLLNKQSICRGLKTQWYPCDITKIQKNYDSKVPAFVESEVFGYT